MSRRKLQSSLHSGSTDEVEAQFYEALHLGDIERMMACWADEDDIVCIHPGSPRLVGIAQVRAAFEALFERGGVQAHPEQICRVESLTSSMHSVVERVQVLTPQGQHDAFVLATNVYQKTAQGWRMVMHHASPGTVAEAQSVSQSPSVLH
jgi:ketosteroid isomerase-like protein